MKNYTDAFRELLRDAEECSSVELIMRYSAATTLFGDITSLLDEDEYEHLKTDQHYPKLRLALTLLRQAAVPDLDEPMDLPRKIRSARENLDKFSREIRP